MNTRVTFHPGGVREYRDGYDRTTYIITGPLPGVVAHVERLYREYPPEGYGTSTELREVFPGGRARYVVKRYASCD